jgi:hypothetical protein
MQIHHKQNIVIPEQVTDTNPLYDLAYIPRDLQKHPQHSLFPYS